MKLYEINTEIERMIDDCIDPETGELVISDELNEMMKQRDGKIENLILYYKNLISNAAELKVEKDKLAEREKTAKNRAERLKQYLSDVLQGESFETARCKVSYRKSVGTEIADGTELPECYCAVTVKPKLAEIKAALQNGETIEGCTLVERQNIIIK